MINFLLSKIVLWQKRITRHWHTTVQDRIIYMNCIHVHTVRWKKWAIYSTVDSPHRALPSSDSRQVGERLGVERVGLVEVVTQRRNGW